MAKFFLNYDNVVVFEAQMNLYVECFMLSKEKMIKLYVVEIMTMD